MPIDDTPSPSRRALACALVMMLPIFAAGLLLHLRPIHFPAGKTTAFARHVQKVAQAKPTGKQICIALRRRHHMAITQDGSNSLNTSIVGSTAGLGGLSWTSGDYIYLIVVNSSVRTVADVSCGGYTWNICSDGTNLASLTYNGNTLSVYCAHATATQSSQTATITFSGTTTGSVSFLSFTGVGSLNANAITYSDGTSGRGTLGGPPVTTTSGPTQMFVVGTFSIPVTDSPPPSGWTISTVEIFASVGCISWLQTAKNAAAGTYTPPSAVSFGSSLHYAFMTIALDAAGSAPTVTLVPTNGCCSDVHPTDTLTWTSTNATTVDITASVGSSPGYVTPTSGGSVSITPGQAVTYTATATGPGGTAYAYVNERYIVSPSLTGFSLSIAGTPAFFLEGY